MRSGSEPKANFPLYNSVFTLTLTNPGVHVLVQIGQDTDPMCVFRPRTLKPLQPGFQLPTLLRLSFPVFLK